MDEAYVTRLLKSYCGMSEVCHKSSFFYSCYTCYTKKYGSPQKVSVNVIDMGPEAGDERYSCVATTSSGETVTGSSYPSIKYAILSLQSEFFELYCDGKPF